VLLGLPMVLCGPLSRLWKASPPWGAVIVVAAGSVLFLCLLYGLQIALAGVCHTAGYWGGGSWLLYR
jgi:hypothetical protein